MADLALDKQILKEAILPILKSVYERLDLMPVSFLFMTKKWVLDRMRADGIDLPFDSARTP